MCSSGKAFNSAYNICGVYGVNDSPFNTPVWNKIYKASVLKSILKEIKPYTDNIYLHVKGEPLLHPQIIEFLNIASDLLLYT